MATGVIRLDSIDEVFLKAAEMQSRTASHASSSDRSSSGVSSESNSPAGTPVITSFSNPSAELEDPRAYSNPALVLDPGDLASENVCTRSLCTGVVSLTDELWLDVEARLEQRPLSLPKGPTLAEKCRHFVQIRKFRHFSKMDEPSTSQGRSVSVSMLPTKQLNGDERPLSPRGSDDQDENARSAATSSAADSTPTAPSTSRAGAAPAREAARKDPDAVPPISCTPVYVVILLAIFLVLVVGAITTIIDMKPELIYGKKVANQTNDPQNSLNATHPL